MREHSFKSTRYLLFMLIAMVTAMASTLTFSAPAQADGSGDGNTGGGNTCSYSNVDVALVYAVNQVKTSNPGGAYCANGGTTHAWNFSAEIRKCYANRNKMLNIWYLNNRANGEWMMYPGAGNSRTTKAYWNSVIDKAYNNGWINTKNNKYSDKAIRDEAKRIANQVGKNIIIVCIWEQDKLLNQKCPTYNANASLNDVRRWVRPSRSGAVIPAAQNTNDKRGSWCFARSESETINRNFITNGTVPGKVYDYAWRCVVADGTPSHHGGPTPFTPQASEPVYTPLGNLLNTHAVNNSKPTVPQADAADAQKNTANRCGITLSDSNKKWLAEGDVMNVQEFTTRASLDDDWVKTQPQRCSHSRTYTFRLAASGTANMTPNAWNPACDRSAGKNASGWTDNGAATTVHNYYIAAQTPELTGFWQSLTNHANSGDEGVGFKDALTSKNSLATPIDDVANGDAAKKWSGSAVTREIEPVNGVSPAAHMVWGAGALDPQGTDTVGFFDKEAAYTGVKAEGDNPALQTQPRDNTFRNFVVDLYKPKAEGVVHGDAGEAITTTVSRWDIGTPLPGNVSNKGTFAMKAPSGDHFFTGARKDAAVQRNWSTTLDKSYTWGQVRGEITSFQTAATWATETAMPNVFTVKWEYAPTVDNTVPTTVGFGQAGARHFDTTVVGVKVQGKVQGKTDGSATSPALFSEQERFTGTGSVNELDGLLYWGTDLDASNKWVQDPVKFSDYYSALRFVRFTAQ